MGEGSGVIFAAFPLDEALGTVVAHTHRLGERVIRKGSTLDTVAIAALRGAGRVDVIAARLEPGDVTEDASAARVAACLAAPGLALGRAATGRVNLHAEAPGLLLVNARTVDRMNSVDPAVTLATLPDASVVATRDMLATIKIIPFAVADDVLTRVETAAAGDPAFKLHPFAALRVGLVLTELPGLKESVAEGTIEATRARVTALGGTLLPPLRCPHAEAAIAQACRALLDSGAELLLVAGASATVDARDVGPAGVVRAGGDIVHFGMPVDPGNLICVGRVGTVPAIVLPGCARSPKLNGIDLVLRRLFAGLPATGPEIMRMGVGGLLKDTNVRPLPRARATVPTPQPGRATRPVVAAVILAAGKSTRMAPHNKLLLKDRTGKPIVVRVVENVLSSGARPVRVVLGHSADEVRAALGGRPVEFVTADAYADGLSASLKAGIASLGANISAAVVCLGDMPLVTGRVIDRLIATYDPDEGRSIVVPTCRGEVGNPILWDRRYFADILALSGDTGARSLLRRHVEQVAEVEIGDDAVLRDFDTVESLGDLPERLRPEHVG